MLASIPRSLTKPLTTLTRLTATQTCNAPAAAASAMAQGKFVSDSIVSTLLESRVSQPDCQTCGWLLDGYPRTASQASHLLSDPSLSPDAVIELVTDESDIRRRLLDRRHDPYTNLVYNIRTSPPSDSSVHARLESRPDDAPHVVEERLRRYHREMPAVRERFEAANVPVIRVIPPRDADMEEVHGCIMRAMDSVARATKIVLAGAPGCGKGTQGALLAKNNGVVHLSTGDLLRDAARGDRGVRFSSRLYGVFDSLNKSSGLASIGAMV